MIEVTELTKRYGATTAVDHLTFTVEPGRVTGFLGRNGAGKSTTMRLIMGLARPDSGRAHVSGRPYRQLARPLHEVGALLEARTAHAGRTARHHLFWLAQMHGIPAARVDEVLELAELSAVADRRLGVFSLGMTQRLGMAAALLGDPGVLILDEPMNGLDPEGIVWVRGLLKQLAAEGRTVLVSSHLMSEMAQLADHLIIIGRGRLIADTGTAEFIEKHTPGQVLVHSPQPLQLRQVLEDAGAAVATSDGDGSLTVIGLDCRQVGDLAHTHRIAVHGLYEQRASLEAAFMELTSRPRTPPTMTAPSRPPSTSWR